MSSAPDIHVGLSMSTQKGSCNACVKSITEHGVAKHQVAVINLRSISVRVCKECRDILVAQLNQINFNRK